MLEKLLQRIDQNLKDKIPYLDLSNCGLEKVPESIQEMEWLRILNLSNNRDLQDITALSTLINLQTLFLENTKIDKFDSIANLFNLRNIYCTNSQLHDLQPLLPLVKNGMEVLYSNRGLDTILTNKKFIQIYNCPIVTPPIEIIRQGRVSILQYFEEIKRAKQSNTLIRLSEAKCLILGEGGAGKTSLTRKLLNFENALPEEQDTTKGINVHPLDWKLPDGTDFRLNIWDFGGQEIYHATHQFFLTKRSLYLLLDDTRKDGKGVDDPIFNYWLQVASLYGGGSPLIIIQNEKGDRSKELDIRGMQGRFAFVKDTKATNLLTCRGLDKVWEAIKFWLNQLPHITEEQPKAWLDIRRELEHLAQEKKRDHISLEEYYQICANNTIPERERALFLSGYLHDFGAFLHFQDHSLLRRMLVLNNEWATDAVYKVLDCEDVKRAFGRFTRRDLATIWAEDRYADQHEELLALMEKFELCYKLIEEKTETWLAPQLLSVSQPNALEWVEAENLQVRYEYEFMPKGLLSQHIVRMNRYVRQPELAWKSGVVFERQGSSALVSEAWGSRKISLRARGILAKELLILLTEDFDKMHERLDGLKVKKLIPCNCILCIKAVEPHFYEYEKLAKRRADGKLTVECDVSYEDVSIKGLLDEIFEKKSPTILTDDQLDSESKERLLVGEVTALIAKAGQISREKHVSDHGIDMEIEFKNDKNEATGKFLFLQLKSGDSYLKRRKDGTEIFIIPKDRHIDYWKDYIGPVMLVIRRSSGEILWMEIGELLQQAVKSGVRPKSIVFQGEPFIAPNILKWRDRIFKSIQKKSQ
jgi:internalin A